MNLTVSHLNKMRLPLLHKIYKENYPSGKPKGKEEILILEDDKKIIGSVRIKTYQDCNFLTGMMIIENRRRKKLGNYFLKEIMTRIDNIQNCYCFCEPSLLSFYTQNHFIIAESKFIPNVIRSKFERYSNSGKKLHILRYKKD